MGVRRMHNDTVTAMMMMMMREERKVLTETKKNKVQRKRHEENKDGGARGIVCGVRHREQTGKRKANEQRGSIPPHP